MRKRKFRKKRVGFLSVTVLLLCAFSGCDSAKNTYVPPPPPEVTVSLPVQKTVTRYAEFTGITEALESVEIRARVEGVLQEIHFQPSQKVNKGDLLFTLDPLPYQARVDQANAELAVKNAQYQLAESTLKRMEMAYRTRAVSEVSIIESKANLEMAKASIAAAQAGLTGAELDLSYTKIYAPISGRIGRSLRDTANLVCSAGDKTLLTTIVNDDRIYAYFNISESDLLVYREKSGHQGEERNKEEHPVFLALQNEEGYPHNGIGDFMENRVDTSTGTIQVRAVFENADHILLPGLFVRIRIAMGQEKDALLISERALGTDQQGRYLLAVNSRNTVEYRPVEVGQSQEGMRVIRSGIRSDDRIIVRGIQKARPGSVVEPKTEKDLSDTNQNAEPKS